MRVEVLHGDATAVEGDVLALKYAQARYGLDSHVADLLLEAGHSQRSMSPRTGGFRLLPGTKGIAARRVLFVGVESLYKFGYQEIRAFSRRVLSSLAGELPGTKRILITLHGAEYGLDEAEAFESELAGFLDAFETGDAPEGLEVISFIERNRGRAKRLKRLLDQVIPDGVVNLRSPSRSEKARKNARERLRAAGYASASKAHVFVAMPFSEELDDLYDYGIFNAVKSVGLLCERADLSAFTGDVMAWVRDRITSASVVVAVLAGANPNVYLEVGYAWGCGIPTILLSPEADDLRFDVQGQKCLIYKKIKDVEEKLSRELKLLPTIAAESLGRQ